MGLTGIVVTQGKEWRVYPGKGHNGTQMISYPTEADVREAALDYLKGQLANGNTLATLLLETINFQAGKVIVLSPVPLDSTQLLEFDWGHVPQKPEDATHVTIRGQSFLAYPKPSDVEGFEQIRRELTAHCAQPPVRVKRSYLPWFAEALFAAVFLLAVFSHNLFVLLISSATVLLIWPVWVAYSLRRTWQTRKVPNRVLLACFLIWLLMLVWSVFRFVNRNF